MTKTLIKGSGPKVSTGEYVIAQYVGLHLADQEGLRLLLVLRLAVRLRHWRPPEQVIPGWDKGLVGQTVGSRVMLVIPPSDGYGSAGQSDAGIKGTDTLVFVVDIVDALKKA